MSPARRPLAGIAVAAALVLTACGDDEPAPAASSSTSAATAAETSPEVLDRPEQQQVDATTAKGALPTLEDLPKGWAVNASPVTDDERTYEPAECAAVERRTSQAAAFEEEHLEVTERVAYSEWTEGIASHLAVTLHSYDEPYPTTFFDEAGQRLGECSEYTRTIDGDAQTWQTRALTTPTVGDRALGVRYTADGDRGGRITDELTVRSGHNVIVVKYLPSDTSYDDDLLQEYARDVLDRLEQAS
ncbi:sensor domain-containing protein [Janibacter anophelis]|uniref:sensor domain-containing protein n=1 Tax=Janibacter anophelis TaxID=319054 RepID=UPI0008353823|nr:sensor domain-containing protein [Janibacter anophelis]